MFFSFLITLFSTIPFAGHTNFVLATFDNPASISPYRVNTSYRRPAGGDSDHGYSTMTPHEDSEHASLPCLEPLIIGRDRYKPGHHSLSITKNPILPPPPLTSRRSRSPTPPQTRLSGYQPIPEQTCIPSQTIINTPIPESSHNIIANVQVHMVDTHWLGFSFSFTACTKDAFRSCCLFNNICGVSTFAESPTQTGVRREQIVHGGQNGNGDTQRALTILSYS